MTKTSPLLLVSCLLHFAGSGIASADSPNPPSPEKAPQVRWPGCVSIFHGHNWGADEKFLVALKEANFGATGATEPQIEQCRQHGLKAFVFAWPHESIAFAPKYKDDPTVLAYYMSDRVRPGKWGDFAEMEKNMYQGDVHHPAIFTMYALMGGIDKFVPEVRPRALEFYHYHWDPRRAPHRRFEILDQFRREGLKAGGIPVTEIILVMHDDVRKTRQSVYTSLAYGTRGFRWWGGGLFFDTAQRDDRGVPRRTLLGDDVAKINSAIKAYDPVFAKTRSVDVFHVPPHPPGTREAPADSWVKLGGEEVLVGVLEDDQKNHFLMLANRDAFKPHEATLLLSGEINEVRKREKSTGAWQPLAAQRENGELIVRVPLEEGGGELLSVSRAKAD